MPRGLSIETTPTIEIRKLMYSTEPIYYPIPNQKVDLSRCPHYVEGIGPVLNAKKCTQPYVFHAMPSFPEGDTLKTRVARGGSVCTKGHNNHIFTYTFPRNNIAANNNIDMPEREEMKAIVGESFYNLVLTTKYGIQKIIRMGSERPDGFLAIVDSSGFDEILRYGDEGGGHYYYVHQAVKAHEANIIDVVRIEGRSSHQRFGFYHFNDFEYVPGLVGVVPLEEYTKKCSLNMQHKLNAVANKIYIEPPLPLPTRINHYVEANQKLTNIK